MNATETENHVRTGDPINNQVREVRSSQASKEMAYGTMKLDDLRRRFTELAAKCEANQSRKRQIESRLSTLNGQVIGGGRLPQTEYRSIVEEQVTLKKELGVILANGGQDKLLLGKLRAAIERQEGTEFVPLAPIAQNILAELKAVRVLLEKLNGSRP